MNTNINENLGTTIEHCDMLAQEAERQIDMLVILSLHSLEQMTSPQSIGHVAEALVTIKKIASELMNDINFVAEKAGWNNKEHKDIERHHRILDAARKAFKEEATKEGRGQHE